MGTRQTLQAALADHLSACPDWYALFPGADAAAQQAAARAACTLSDGELIASGPRALIWCETVRTDQRGLGEAAVTAELLWPATGATPALRAAAADDLADAVASHLAAAADLRTVAIELTAPLLELESGGALDGWTSLILTWTARAAA